MAETLGFPVPLPQRFRPLSITCPRFLTTCRAACLTLLTRLELALGERTAAMRLLPDAERAWRSALDWLERVRPGETPAEQAECHRLLQRAADYTAALGGPADRQPGPALDQPLAPAGLTPNRRKLLAAVAVATCGADAARAASA